MTATTINGIKTIPPIPKKGERYLSINLALVDFGEVSDIAKELGFKPELVQIPYRFGTEIHALLWQGAIADTPADLDERIAQLADHINNQAIRHAYSRRNAA